MNTIFFYNLAYENMLHKSVCIDYAAGAPTSVGIQGAGGIHSILSPSCGLYEYINKYIYWRGGRGVALKP